MKKTLYACVSVFVLFCAAALLPEVADAQTIVTGTFLGPSGKTPSAAGLRVIGTVSGTAVCGELDFMPWDIILNVDVAMEWEGITYLPQKVRGYVRCSDGALIDSSGTSGVVLIPNSDAQPTGTVYLMTGGLSGARDGSVGPVSWKEAKEVPDVSTADWTQLSPAQVADPAYSYVLQTNGSVFGYQTWQGTTVPASSPSGSAVLGYNATGKVFECVNPDGSSCFAAASGSVSVNGSLVSAPNFNSASPVADANNLAATWKVSGSGAITELPVFTASGSSHSMGLVPDPGASAGSLRFLNENGTFVQPSYSNLLGLPTLYNQTVDNSGTALTQRPSLNFLGSGVSCVDNAGASRTDCTISSGGSGFVAGGDLSGSSTSQTVIGLNGLALPTLAASTGYMYDNAGVLGLSTSASNFTTGTLPHAQLPTLLSGDIPNNAANTTGSAAKWTTARLIAGNSVDGSANIAFPNKFVVGGTTDSGLSGAQFLGSLGTGIVKNTTATGTLSIAIASDFPTLNQSTTGNAATATALAVTPTLCTGGQAPTGIVANGNATGCFTPSGSGTVTHSLGALTSGQLAIGNGAGDLAVGNLSGDVTTSGGTATTVGSIGGTLVAITSPAIGQTLTVNGTPELVNAYPGVTVDSQASSTPTLHGDGAGSDRLAIVNTTNITGSTAFPIAQAGSSTFASSYAFGHCNSGTVVATDTPTTSNVNGNSTLVLQGAVAGNNPECSLWWTNGGNWLAAEILPTDANGRLQAAGFPALTGDVNSTAGSLATTVVKVNGAAVPTSATVLSSNSSNQLIAATLQGNGAKVQLSTGTTTTNDCVKFDVNGNTVDAGAACGAGGAVSSFSGDGTLITNSASTGAVTLTLGTAGAHKWWGNNTGSTTAPGYEALTASDLPATTVFNNQANTYSTGLQNLNSATLELPSSASYAPTTASLFGYDSTNKRAVLGNGTNTSFIPWFTAAPTSGQFVTWSGTLGALTGVGSSGTGSVCMTTSCAMTTPNLGTPSALTLTNATGLPLTGIATESADTFLANASGSSASPAAVSFPVTGTNGCAGATNALTYNTTTHSIGCNTISGGGTPGGAAGNLQFNSAGTSFAGAATTVMLNHGANQIPATPTAGTTYMLSDTGGNYTQSAAVTVSANGVAILCTSPNVVIQFTGATDGFDVTGSHDLIHGCTLDHNSQTAAGTGPLINVTAGSDAQVLGNFFQNVGNTNPTSATIQVAPPASTTVSNVIVRGNRCGNPTTSCTTDPFFVALTSSASATISGVYFQQNIVNANYTTGSPTFFVSNIEESSSLGIIQHVSETDNTIYAQGANGTAFGWQTTIAPSGENPDEVFSFANNRVIATARLNECGKFFGIHHAQIIGNVCEEGAFTFNGGWNFGDTYYSQITGNSCADEGGNNGGACIAFADYGRNVVDGNIAEGIWGTGGFSFETVAGIGSDSIISDNQCQFLAGKAGTCMTLDSGTASFASTNNDIHGNHFVGDGTAGQVALSLTDTAGTISGYNIGRNSFSDVTTGISIASGVTNTSIAPQKFVSVTTPISDSGTGTDIQGRTYASTVTLASGTGTFTIPAGGAFSTTSTFACVANDTTTTTNAVKAVPATTTTATVTGTGTDVISVSCSGH